MCSAGIQAAAPAPWRKSPRRPGAALARTRCSKIAGPTAPQEAVSTRRIPGGCRRDDPPIDLVHLARQCQGDPDLEAELLGLFGCRRRARRATVRSVEMSAPSRRRSRPQASRLGAGDRRRRGSPARPRRSRTAPARARRPRARTRRGRWPSRPRRRRCRGHRRDRTPSPLTSPGIRSNGGAVAGEIARERRRPFRRRSACSMKAPPGAAGSLRVRVMSFMEFIRLHDKSHLYRRFGAARTVEAQVGSTVMETALRNSVPGHRGRMRRRLRLRDLPRLCRAGMDARSSANPRRWRRTCSISPSRCGRTRGCPARSRSREALDGLVVTTPAKQG